MPGRLLGRCSRRALSVVLVATALSAQPSPAATTESACSAERIDAWSESEHVHDGDTLRLRDGRKVRLIGINAPEIGFDGNPSEPLAERSRDVLSALAPSGTRLGLRYGRERADHYGRTLAHVFLEDGSSVQARLLDAGLAFHIAVPPNTALARCYESREAKARAARIGMWALSRYRPVAAQALRAGDKGFHLVQGTVERVGESRDNWWLNLSRHMAVRIPKSDLAYFDHYRPERLAGRRVEVRGWLTMRNGELRITARHPAALVVLD